MQATRVMMTGRVLLVCALCVLWCGVAVAVSAADGDGNADGGAGEYLVLQRHALLESECAEEIRKRTGGWASASIVEECVREGMDSVHAVVDGRRRWKSHQYAVAASVESDKGDPDGLEGTASTNVASGGKSLLGTPGKPRVAGEGDPSILPQSPQDAAEMGKSAPNPDVDTELGERGGAPSPEKSDEALKGERERDKQEQRGKKQNEQAKELELGGGKGKGSIPSVATEGSTNGTQSHDSSVSSSRSGGAASKPPEVKPAPEENRKSNQQSEVPVGEKHRENGDTADVLPEGEGGFKTGPAVTTKPSDTTTTVKGDSGDSASEEAQPLLANQVSLGAGEQALPGVSPPATQSVGAQADPLPLKPPIVAEVKDPKTERSSAELRSEPPTTARGSQQQPEPARAQSDTNQKLLQSRLGSEGTESGTNPALGAAGIQKEDEDESDPQDGRLNTPDAAENTPNPQQQPTVPSSSSGSFAPPSQRKEPTQEEAFDNNKPADTEVTEEGRQLDPVADSGKKTTLADIVESNAASTAGGDSSTAASHSASPLLLLLIACAAAMVAA